MDRRRITRLIVALALAAATAQADQHIYTATTYEAGSSLEIVPTVPLTGTWDFSSATVIGISSGGGGITYVGTTAPLQGGPITGVGTINIDPAKVTAWDLANTDRLKWDGGATGLTASTGRISLGLRIGIDVQEWSAALDTWATTTNNAGNWNTAYTERNQWNGGATGLTAATGRSSLGLGTAAQQDVIAFKPNFTFAQSLQQALEGNTATLVSDSATPGNSKYYGTDGTGSKGWYSLPTGGGGTGDVTGPASSVDSEIAIFNGTTGKAIKNAAGSGLAKLSSGVLGTITDNSTNWNTAYTERAQWDGGFTGLNAVTGRGSLGASAIGDALFVITTPLTTSWMKLTNAGAVVKENAATTRSSLGATTTGDALFTITPPSATSWIKLSSLGAAVTEDAPTTRTSLGLVIGTNVQAQDSDLDNIAALATTGYGRAFLTQADAAAARSYIGAGTGGGDLSSNTSTSVDGELALFNLTSGKSIRRATETGIPTLTSGKIATITDNSGNWNTAYTDRLKWDGGATGLTASTGRASLGATVPGSAIFTVATPGATSWLKLSNDGTIQVENAATTRTSLGATSVGASLFTLATPSVTSWVMTSAAGTAVNSDAAAVRSALSLNNVTNDAQIKAADFPASSVDSEVAVFSSTGGKTIKRATGSGIATLASGVLGTTTDNHTAWDTASTERRQWDGSATNLVAATGRASLVIGDAEVYENSSITGQANTFGSDTYLVGSTITLPAGGWKQGGQYKCIFDLVKTAAGTTPFLYSVRIGTAGTISDPAIFTSTNTTNQTAATDQARMEIQVIFRAVGASAQVVSLLNMIRLNTGATGFFNVALPNLPGTGGLGSTFNSTTQTKLGISFNGGTSFSGTVQMVQTEYKQ